jgi:hypothetical protein
MTVGLDNSGNVILSGTFSGVTVSHTVGDTTTTTASAAIAGIDMSVTNKAGATTWSLDTTVSGVDLTLTSAQKITAAFGLAGNTMTVTRNPAVATAASSAGTAAGTGSNGYGTYSVSNTSQPLLKPKSDSSSASDDVIFGPALHFAPPFPAAETVYTGVITLYDFKSPV